MQSPSSNNMSKYRFSFADKKHKTTCPSCKKEKHFQRYIDNSTGQLLSAEFGKCDNESKCGFWNKPKFEPQKTTYRPSVTTTTTEPIFFDTKVYQKFRNHDNNFVSGLFKIYPRYQVTEVLEAYQVGSYRGFTLFPFMDRKSNIRAVQAKLFNENLHTKGTTYLHYLLEKYENVPNWLVRYSEQKNKVSALFGEHLIESCKEKIYLVEAPKTAIIATLHFPKFLWLAVGSKSYFTSERMKPLIGKNVCVVPDLSIGGLTFNEWKLKADMLGFKTYGKLERIATDKQRSEGWDLADFLLNKMQL
jgi:hypothetical protein